MKTSKNLGSHLREITVRCVIAYPICFYLYGSISAAQVCVGNFSSLCIPMILFSPIFMIIGPIAHEDEDPPNLYLRVLVVAIIAATAWTFFSCFRRRQREQSVKPVPAKVREP